VAAEREVTKGKQEIGFKWSGGQSVVFSSRVLVSLVAGRHPSTMGSNQPSSSCTLNFPFILPVEAAGVIRIGYTMTECNLARGPCFSRRTPGIRGSRGTGSAMA
jgi:hypothetical protein